jgi:general secretion pathway protein A
MYQVFYGIKEAPFSIVPSARFLYLSERHREALHYMLAGVNDGGGLALLTGEVGTGKTTLMRSLLAQLPNETQVALILNPALSAQDLLLSLCDELSIGVKEAASYKTLIDSLNRHLLANHAKGWQTVLLVDEAQHLSADVLEQLRLLTNLETDARKLLKVVLIGQPELQWLLQQEKLRQLAQRITSRYHLLPLTPVEVAQYVRYRLQAVECPHAVFSDNALSLIAKSTQGIPRVINLVCDKAMQLGAENQEYTVSKRIVRQACEEVLRWQTPSGSFQKNAQRKTPWLPMSMGVLLACGVAFGISEWRMQESWPDFFKDETEIHSELPPITPVKAQAIAPAPTLKTNQPKSWQAFGQLIDKSRTQQEAMQMLYRVWGYEVTLGQANCLSTSRINLACYQGDGDIDDLMSINRPAMITLNDPDFGAYTAVLYGLSAGKAELLMGEKRIQVSQRWLKAHWMSDYQLLWRPPLGKANSIRYGQSGARVQWLNRQLNRVLGEEMPASSRFDQSTLDKLRHFQRAHRLTADGIAGPRTLMVLDSALALPGPTLHGRG